MKEGKRALALLAALGAFAAASVLLAAPAAAHEERRVGAYHVEVGFGTEPAYAGQPNSVQLLLNDAQGRPVTDLGDSLKVEVIYGDQTKELALEPFFEVGGDGTPGDYRAFFIPTRTGTYAFHFTGSIGDQQIDETFTSGPDTFSDVISPTEQEFPVQDPTTAELATKIDREVARLEEQISNGSGSNGLAIAALLVGALGAALGGWALVLARRGRG